MNLHFIHLLRHQFIHEKIDFAEPVLEGKADRRRVDSKLRRKICNWRQHRLFAGEITHLLSEEGIAISVRTVERVLAEEGFTELPRRSRLKLGFTVKGAEVPAVSKAITLGELEGKKFNCKLQPPHFVAPHFFGDEVIAFDPEIVVRQIFQAVNRRFSQAQFKPVQMIFKIRVIPK